MKIIILNHKMNLYYEDLNNYIERINKISNNIIIAPSNIYLLEFVKKCKHTISSQDICYIEEGNYTSKVSWSQIKSLGINHSIIGHSEKNEVIQKTKLKLKACIENDIIPILCFGKGEDNIDLLDKLTENLTSIDNIIFAYEPINNINNNNIDIDKIEKEINLIYDYLYKKYKSKPTLLYGGGIIENNVKRIYNIKKLDGILIGSISSDIEKIEKILLMINEK